MTSQCDVCASAVALARPPGGKCSAPGSSDRSREMAARAQARGAARSAAILCLSLCCALPGASTNSCSVDVNRDLAVQEPLLLVDGRLAAPRGGPRRNSSAAILFSGPATVACPGRRNRLVGLGQQRVEVACRHGSTVTLAGRSVTLRELQCASRLAASLQATDTPCGPGGASLVRLGFKVGDQFHDIITACHDSLQVSTLYTRHVLHGAALGGRQASDGTPGFESGSLHHGFAIARLYKQTTVSSTLTRLLGSRTLADRYLLKTFISRGHLAPRADFVLQAYQNATFFYANVAPQWQSVNRGNWLHVEDRVRRLAQRLEHDLVVFTGTSGVLALRDHQGRPQEVYLHGGATRKLPVPKFLWKVVYDPSARAAIAFVTLNDPFLEGGLRVEDRLCEDSCRDHGWQFASQHSATLGHTYCCDVRHLRRRVSYLPSIDVGSVLKYKY
ncbi:uncharacterized protein LOC134536537 [Bacillus rossius redtenbacheri]|uniref:uncharacterized protein LOC134536537 n=1 Tax=Bacillus rossius redtenbacheri TaxID=93214 RepID=UPI002FDE6D3B